jgi:hypothetical protein
MAEVWTNREEPEALTYLDLGTEFAKSTYLERGKRADTLKAG